MLVTEFGIVNAPLRPPQLEKAPPPIVTRLLDKVKLENPESFSNA
jgi:hypothetical protein